MNSSRKVVKIKDGSGQIGVFSFRPYPDSGKIGVRYNAEPEKLKDPKDLLDSLKMFFEHYPGDTAKEFRDAIRYCIKMNDESRN